MTYYRRKTLSGINLLLAMLLTATAFANAIEFSQTPQFGSLKIEWTRVDANAAKDIPQSYYKVLQNDKLTANLTTQVTNQGTENTSPTRLFYRWIKIVQGTPVTFTSDAEIPALAPGQSARLYFPITNNYDWTDTSEIQVFISKNDLKDAGTWMVIDASAPLPETQAKPHVDWIKPDPAKTAALYQARLSENAVFLKAQANNSQDKQTLEQYCYYWTPWLQLMLGTGISVQVPAMAPGEVATVYLAIEEPIPESPLIEIINKIVRGKSCVTAPNNGIEYTVKTFKETTRPTASPTNTPTLTPTTQPTGQAEAPKFVIETLKQVKTAKQEEKRVETAKQGQTYYFPPGDKTRFYATSNSETFAAFDASLPASFTVYKDVITIHQGRAFIQGLDAKVDGVAITRHGTSYIVEKLENYTGVTVISGRVNLTDVRLEVVEVKEGQKAEIVNGIVSNPTPAIVRKMVAGNFWQEQAEEEKSSSPADNPLVRLGGLLILLLLLARTIGIGIEWQKQGRI